MEAFQYEVEDINDIIEQQDTSTTISTSTPISTPPRKSQRISKPPKRYQDESFANIAIEEEPQTFDEAINHPTYKEKWEEAIQVEYQSLLDNQTWTLVPLPEGRKTVGCKWIFRHKLGADGNIERFKARLVAKGFTQTYGIDYNETFAPVAKLQSLRLLLAIAAIEDLEVHQMDVKSAFLMGELEEEIYMDQPEGFEEGDQVCRLKKSLYGLKQSPRVWNYKLHDFFTTNRFTQTNADHSIYINKSNDAMIGIWVDDLIIVGRNLNIINDLKKKLNDTFEMKDLKDLTYFLGIQVKRDRSRKTLHLNQTQYIEKILSKFGMEDYKPVGTPMETSVKLTKPQDNEELFEAWKYQSAVGSLMYGMLGTRPDIAFVVSAVSRYNNNPTKRHWTIVKRVLRYLKGSHNFGITYEESKPYLIGYCDSDWGGDLDTRKSTTGYVFLYGNGAIS